MPPSDVLLLTALFAAGSLVGTLLNLAIHTLCWNPRPYSPWLPHPLDRDKRRPVDLLPIAGWLFWRKKVRDARGAFWIRAMIVEILAGLLFAGLYWWEVMEQGLLPHVPVGQGVKWMFAAPGGESLFLHAQYVAHVLLVSLMIAASFIDVDEKTIPDEITVPGALAGLILSAAYPWVLFPVKGAPLPVIDFLRFVSPHPWPRTFDGSYGLWLGAACYTCWCLALLPWTWRTRRGLAWALKIASARIAREPWSRIVGLGWGLGSCGIVLVWWMGGARWEGLLTSLVGMAAGGGIVWSVRIVASSTLRREAMGFGDVTLMAMIGAFLGWQAALIIFFLSPLIGLAFAAAQYLTRGETEIYFGPFLCMAALFVMLRWRITWAWFLSVLELEFFLPMLLLFPFFLGGMLLLKRLLWRLFGRGE